MIDLLRYLLGPLSVKSVRAVTAERYTTILTFGADGLAVLHATGPREDFIFEIDLIGSKGRIRILDNCSHSDFYCFEDSRRYGGYRELFLEPSREYVSSERFLPLFLEVANCLDGHDGLLIADGRSALATQKVMEDVSRKIREML
jgi:predicted dehydrogenase